MMGVSKIIYFAASVLLVFILSALALVATVGAIYLIVLEALNGGPTWQWLISASVVGLVVVWFVAGTISGELG